MTTATDRDVIEEKLKDPTSSPIYLPFEFLRDITCDFSSDHELGRGGYGTVYKGVLRSGEIIAVKKLFDIHVMEDDQFHKEVNNLMGTKHQNIVRLVGYCAESKWESIKLSGEHVMAHIPKRLLCFEYMDNNSLDKYVSDESPVILDWNKRYEIVKGICTGLHFLHEECNIIHLDLKPANILMDDAMMPKIADFGLSRLLGAQKTRTIVNENLGGTLGYMAPEYIVQGVASSKADIFSFGVIMIEIITGRKEYPLCTIPYNQKLNENGGSKSTENALQQYTENVLERWRNIFEKQPSYNSPEIYTEQVKKCINIALEFVDPDMTKRPNICKLFRKLTGETSCCQKKRILSAEPLELQFNLKGKHVMSACSMQLTNNTDEAVAFRILTNNFEKYFLGPLYGLVLPRSKYNLRVTMCVPSEHDTRFTLKLQNTIARGQHQLPDIHASESADAYNRFFTETKNKGNEVQKVELSAVIVHEPGNMIIPDYPDDVKDIYVHPKETWIITRHLRGSLHIWDYLTQETVSSFKLTAQDHVTAAIFIPRKQWFVVGTSVGYIKVYEYEAMQEVKTFIAHGNDIISLDIHPTEPYVLSSSLRDKLIKLWNWENGWECARTFDSGASQVKFNPNDPDYFACALHQRYLQIWNIASSGSRDNFTLPKQKSRVVCFDYFTRGDQLHLIIGQGDGSVGIWNWQRRNCVKILQGHTEWVETVSAHPDLPILITGSEDGTVRIWNSITFELEDILHCGLGDVLSIACLKGSRRIAIAHEKGLAVIEIDYKQQCETPQNEDEDT